MPNDPGFPSSRRQLLMSTALAGGMLATGGLATGAQAQVALPGTPVTLPGTPVTLPGTKVLPDVGAAQTMTSSGDANRAPVFQLGPPTGGEARLDVVLRDKGTIINWGGTGFNIGARARVDFSDGFSTGARGAIAVLNRDVNTLNDRSVILGSLTTSSDNISVYLLNRNGILFGPGASVNTGSFVASTLDLADGDFFNGATNRFSGTGGTITLQGNATLRNSAANGALALLAGSVDIGRDTVIDARGDVAIVAATDVSLTMEPGSPLSMTITRGTAIANPLIVAGTVGGRNVYLAMATRDSVRDALLNITGTVIATTALVTDRGVVLAAGSGANAPGVAIAGSDTAGGAVIEVGGTVTARRATGSPDAVANVAIAARGDVSGGGAIAAANRLDVRIGGTVNLTGATSAGTGARFAAARDVDVARAAVASGDLLLDAGANVRLDDARLTAQNGNVALTGAAKLTGASTVSAGGPGSTVSFRGTVDGPGSLTTSSGAGARFDGAVGDGARLGSLTVGGLATLNAGAMRAGAIRLGALDVGTLAPAAVTVDAGTGALTIDGATNAATADANRLTLIGGSIAVRDVGTGSRFAAVTFSGDTSLTGDVAAAGAVRFDGRLLLGAGIRRVNAATADFRTVDAAGAAPATLSVNVTGASRFAAAIGGSRAINLALRVGSASFSGTNQVGTLAARVAGGGLAFTNGGSLTIGTVDGLTGLTVGGGDVRVATTAGAADLRLAAPVLASAGNLILSAARDLTGTTAATVTGSGRVELSGTGGAIDLSGAVGAGGDIDASAPGRIRLATLTAGRDVRVAAGDALTVGGAASGRDIAIRAGGALTAGDLSAGDDLVLRAGGLATLGLLASGTNAGSDAPGAGDLLAGGTLNGGDVDVVAAGIRLGSVRAGGIGSDIRLDGGTTGIGEAARDLDLRAGGGIVLAGSARGLDIALSAQGGSVVAGDLTARDDIAVRATDAITLANASSGVAIDGQAPLDRDGAADALAGALAGADIDLDAGSVSVAAANAGGAGGDLRVNARTGNLLLGAGQAGAAVTLAKTGSESELQVTGTVRGGTASPNGDVVLTSSTDARLGAATSASGIVSVTASRDVTGVGAAGRADLRSEAGGADVLVRAGGLARLGTASAGRDLAVIAGAIDLLAGNGRDIALQATNGNAALGTLRARDDVAVRASGAITGDAVRSGVDGATDEAGAADALAGTGASTALAGNDIDAAGASIALGRADANGEASDLRLAANAGDLTLGGGSAGGGAALTKTGDAGELRVTGGLVAGGDVRIASATAARLAAVTTRTGSLSVETAGEATGGTLRADAGDVTVVGGPLVAFDTLSANRNLRVDAGSVLVGTGVAERGSLALQASTGQLTLGIGSAGEGATLSKTGAAGELRVTESLVADGDVRIASATAARLAVVTSRTGSLSVEVAGEATGGALRADAGDMTLLGGPLIAFDTLSANGNLRAEGGSVLVGTGVAERGAVTLGASSGQLTLGTGSAGAGATLSKTGGGGELRVTESLVAGGDVRIASATAARLASVTSRTGLLSVEVAGEATGGALRADAGDVAVVGGGLIAFDTLSANGNLRADAGSVLVGTGVAERGGLALRASTGPLTLGIGTAGAGATLGKAGGGGELRITDTLVAGGDVRIESATAARLAAVTSRAGVLSVEAAGEATGGALRADAGDVTVAGGPLVAFDTLSANGNLRAEGGSVRVGAGIAERGGLTLRASAGQLTLGRGSAGAGATLSKTGGDGALEVTGLLTAGTAGAGGDVTIASATQARIGEAVSRKGDARVTAASDVTGAGGAAGATLRAGRDVAVVAGPLARLGTVEAGRDVSVTADAVEVAKGSGRDIALVARTGSATLGALAARDDIVVRAGGTVTATALTSGGDAKADEDGVADLLAGRTLVGGDIDVSGASIDIGSAIAAGPASDLRLAATKGKLRLGDADVGGAVDLSADGPDGELEITGGLTFAGDASFSSTRSFRFGAITSRSGNLGVRAGGDVVGDRLTSQRGDVLVEAGALASIGALAAARDGTVRADSVQLGTGIVGRDLGLLGRAGQLTLERGSAGGAATLTKQGAAGELVVTEALVTGTGGAGGNAVLTSSTNIRAGRVESASGGVLIQASGGDVTGVGADGRLEIAARGRDAVVRAGGVARLGAVTAARDAAVSAGTIDIVSASGRDVALEARGAVAAGTLQARDDVVVRAAGAVSLRDVSAGTAAGEDGSGAADALAGQALAGNDVDASGTSLSATAVTAAGAGGDVRLRASAGQVSIGSVNAGGGVTIAKEGAAGALAATGAVTAGGDVAIRSATDVRVMSATSRGGNLVVDAARDARSASLSAAGGSVTVRAGSTLAFNEVAAGGDVIGAADAVEIGVANAARGRLDLLARAGDLTLGRGTAASGAVLSKQGAAGELRVTGSLTAGGDVTVTSSTNVRLASAASDGGRLAVVAAGDLTGAALAAAAGDGRAAAGFGGANLQATRSGVTASAGGAIAQLGTVSAGPGLSLKANDLELLGAVVAERVEIVNAGSRGATRLGEGLTAAAGLNLSQAEIDRIDAGRLVVGGGTRDVEIGTLAFSARAGAASIDLLTLGRIDVTGAVSAAASPDAPLRAVRIGGDGADGLATSLRVAATPGGGGRLSFPNAALELRAARIGVGQDLLFLDSLGLTPGGAPLPVSAVVARYISNPASTLYVPARPYASDGGQPPDMINAATLSLRFTDYALVQNTALSGQTPGGVRVGTAATRGSLTLNAGGDRAANAVALFGNINGVGGGQAAVLGSEFVALNGVNRANSRINGCPVGSGGDGCLTAIVFTTPSTPPEESDDVVITLAAEQSMPLDAPVGASNEALIAGAGSDGERPLSGCVEEQAGGACPL